MNTFVAKLKLKIVLCICALLRISFETLFPVLRRNTNDAIHDCIAEKHPNPLFEDGADFPTLEAIPRPLDETELLVEILNRIKGKIQHEETVANASCDTNRTEATDDGTEAISNEANSATEVDNPAFYVLNTPMDQFRKRKRQNLLTLGHRMNVKMKKKTPTHTLATMLRTAALQTDG